MRHHTRNVNQTQVKLANNKSSQNCSVPSNHTRSFWTILNQYGLNQNDVLQNSTSPTAMNAQQQQKCDRICQDAALLNKYSDGSALTEEEKKRVQQLQRMPGSTSADARMQHFWINTTLMPELWLTRRRKGYINWMLHKIRSIGCVTIATWELHGAKTVFIQKTAGFYCIYFKGRGG